MTPTKPSNLISSLLLTSLLSMTLPVMGCGGVNRPAVTTTGPTTTGSSLRGLVKGGQQPISGATIQLYQVGTAGDGSSAAPLGTSTTTSSSGAFTLTGDYTCPGSNPEVYLLATGGNPGLSSGTNNAAIDLIAALGSCNSLTSSTYIVLNEVTTVAAVAALSPYMTSPTGIGSGTSDASQLAAAFTSASQFASTTTGTSPGAGAPAGDAVPSTMINSLADIVSACVNSTGGTAGDGSACGMLFTDATPSGGPAPTNVAMALLNILDNSTSNLASLYALLPATPPFQPVLNAAPSSWAVGLVTTPAGGALVDYGTQEQIIRGFGASEVFDSTIPPSSGQLQALYGQASGQVGLTIMRIQIAPATWSASNCSGSGGSVSNTSVWNTELANAQFVQYYYGALVFATPWSEPANMMTNDSLSGGSLETACYSQYATYLQDFVNYAAAGAFGTTGNGPSGTSLTNGVSLYAVSLQNEPDFDASYGSTLWTGAQFDAWIKGYASALTTGNGTGGTGSVTSPPVLLMMPESDQFAVSESDPSLLDPNAVGYISIIGGHLYATPTPIFYYTNAKNAGKDVWMTEHLLAPLAYNPSTGANPTPTMADALAIAEEIHDSMTVGDYNAYVWWQGPSYPTNKTPQEHLIDQNANPTFYGLAMTQFSRYIRPGYYRYNATATPVSGVYLSAYSGGGHEVIVAINSTSSPVTLPVQFANQTVTSVTPYQTTSTASVSQLSPVTVTNNQFSAALPADSITTFVQ
jgi:glucuronoarabinoxylan endo-1,4-beta-xylanase